MSESDEVKCLNCRRKIRDHAHSVEFSLGAIEGIELHEYCAKRLLYEEICFPMWYQTFTRDHYDAIVEALESLDVVGHVHTSGGAAYHAGEMTVHTNYADTSFAGEFCSAFGGQIYYASVTHEDGDHVFDCVKDHGTCFEMELDFGVGPMCYEPPEKAEEYASGGRFDAEEFVDESTKIFDADFSGYQ